MADQIHVRINSPEKVIWEGDAEWVSSENSDGPFDILAMHTNFITIIENKEIRVKSGSEIQKYKFDKTVLHVHANKVNIYTNI
jgi:F0F1-type ATP synthase epsilon subunit